MTYFKARAFRDDVTYVFAEYIWTRKCIISFIVTLVLLIIITILAVLLLTEDTKISNETTISTDYGDVPIVRRSEWGAMPSKDANATIENLPPEYVIVAHTAGPFCKSKDHCIKTVREIQELHVWSNHWTDIGYNFLVGGDGRVYEGCQWDIEGAHTLGWNKKSIGIAFTGDYRFDVPNEDQIDAVNKLLNLGVKQNKLKDNYKVLAHFQAVNIESPGEHLFDVIKTWKHWSKCPDISEHGACSS